LAAKKIFFNRPNKTSSHRSDPAAHLSVIGSLTCKERWATDYGWVTFLVLLQQIFSKLNSDFEAAVFKIEMLITDIHDLAIFLAKCNDCLKKRTKSHFNPGTIEFNHSIVSIMSYSLQNLNCCS
jgi:hypothetical protein